MASKSGQMAPSTEVIGKTTEHTVRDAFGTRTEINLKASLKMTSQTEKARTLARMELYTKVCG